jgi:hypothetical protein
LEQHRQPTLDSVSVEAAKQLIDNESALHVASGAIMLNHLRALAVAEEETVDRYREKKLFGATNEDLKRKAGDMASQGPLIICDDYKPDMSTHPPQVVIPPTPQNNLVPWIVATALAAGGVGVMANHWMDRGTKPAVEQPKPPPGTSTTIGVGKTVELIQPK